jgi:type II secretory pathway component GspD/PulD (secretin)
LALALDKDVADRLGLSEEVRGRLRQLVNEREDTALDIVLAIKDLPPMIQTARLTPFVEESERLGFALLTLPQREKLRQIRLAREGMSALVEPDLAESLSLSAEQKMVVQKLLDQRAVDLTKGGENERRITRAVYERKLATVLNDSQRATWETLAGLSDAPVRTPVTPAAVDPAAASPAPATTEAEMPVVPQPATAAVEAEMPTVPQPTPAVVEPVTPAVPQPAPAAVEAEKPAMPQPAPAVVEAVTPAVPQPAPAAIEAEKPAMPQPAPAAVEAVTPAVPQPASAAVEAVTPAMPQPAPAAVEAVTPAMPQPAPAAVEAVTPAMPQPAPAAVEAVTPAVPQPVPAVVEAVTPAVPPAGIATVEAEKSTVQQPAEAAGETVMPQPGPVTVEVGRAVVPQPAAGIAESLTPAAPQQSADAVQPLPAITTGLLRFQFDAAPWKDVLQWLAEQSGLSLAIETLPTGSFTYRDDRSYTLDQALDLLNSYLLTKGYTLVRRERILLVLDVENPIPEELVTLVTTEELDTRGRFELVKCLFPLAKMKPEDAAAMIRDFIGPQGKVIPFPKARQILVTETAGKLRTIRDMISRVEEGGETIVEFSLQHVTSEELLSIARPLLGLPEGQNASTDINLSVDLFGTRIWASGNSDKLQLFRELLTKIDKPSAAAGGDAKSPEQLKLATYYIKSADTQLVLRVVQTLLADLPGVRLEVDPMSAKMVAWARPSEHRIIEETLKLLEGQELQFEVIPLKRVDPQLAVMAINKFFGLTSATGDKKDAAKSSAQGPIVDGDAVTMQLWVRGTVLQIEQIRDLLEKLEGPDPEEGTGGTIRTIPLSGAAAKSALETIEQFWTRKNKIRIVTPSNLTPSDIKLRTITPLEQESDDTEFGQPWENWSPVPAPSSPPAANPAASSRTKAADTLDKSAQYRDSSPPSPGHSEACFQFVSQLKPVDEPAGAAVPDPDSPEAAQSIGEVAEIRVAITPSGIVIASEDTKALDELEKLLRTVTGPTAAQGQREISVFYLKYAKAEVAHQLLQEVLGGRTSESGGGSLLGDVASNLLGGGLLGGLVGGLAGGTGGSTSTTTLQASGPVMIVPDLRLNALIIEANATDLMFIEQMLRVIDRESSVTDVETAGQPRLIPIVHSSADEVATVIRQVFADRIGSGQGGGQGQQPSPEDLLRALRGQRTRREDNQTRGEPQKMTVGVDARSNSVIVTAPEQLFRQVEALVHQIDQPGSPDADSVIFVPIKISDPQLIQKTLNSVLGNTTGRTGTRTSGGSSAPSGASNASSAADMQRRIEFFRQLRDSGGLGGAPGGGMPAGGMPGGGMPGGGRPGGDTGGRSTGGRTRGR